MEKSSIVLESLTVSSPRLPVGYQRLSSNPLHIDKYIDFDSSLVHPPLFKPCCANPVPDQPLVGESVDLDWPPVDHCVLEDHHDYTTHVLLFLSYSLEFENNPPILANSECPSSVPVEHGAIIWYPHEVVQPFPSTIVTWLLSAFHPMCPSKLKYMPTIR